MAAAPVRTRRSRASLEAVEARQCSEWREAGVSHRRREAFAPPSPPLSPPPSPPPSPSPSPTPSPVPAADASTGGAALFKYAREVTDTEAAVVPGAMSAEFVAAAAKLHPLLRRVLVEDQVDEDDAALVELLGCTLLTTTRRVLRRRGAISAEGCAALRLAVDAQRDVTRDSVDNMAQHQLNIDADRLTALIGRPEVLALFRIADELLATQRADATARHPYP